jgi:hypothetical protein
MIFMYSLVHGLARLRDNRFLWNVLSHRPPLQYFKLMNEVSSISLKTRNKAYLYVFERALEENSFWCRYLATVANLQ